LLVLISHLEREEEEEEEEDTQRRERRGEDDARDVGDTTGGAVPGEINPPLDASATAAVARA
jgi:hypothetical protein